MELKWDIDKNKANQKKHKISFEEAAEIFRYPIYEIFEGDIIDQISTYHSHKGDYMDKFLRNIKLGCYQEKIHMI